MVDPSHPVFETTDSGLQVAGTGLPRLRAAARAGEAVRARRGGWPWGRSMRRGLDGSRTRRGSDPYTQEEGPGNISRLTRLMMDLRGYGPGKTKDVYGTEADVRAISSSNQNWTGFKLRVLTQNLWGLPVISRCLEARVHAFSKTLGGGWDVIVLQEVWHARERDALRRAALLAGLRYSRHYEPGCGAPVMGPGSGGTGLLVLSRYPITETFFWRFSANGQPYQVQHGDYLGGKGLGLARLHTPAGAVDLYVSHLHADYSRARGAGKTDRYKAHRVAQAFEVAHTIRLTSRSPLVLLLTDLNAGPGSLPYGLQRSVAGLGDAFAEARPGQAGHTCEASDNVFSNERDPPARLDYVLFKAVPPPLCAPQAVEPMWELRDCWVHKAYVPEQDAAGLLLAEASATTTLTSVTVSSPLTVTPAPTVTTTPSSSSPRRNGHNGGDAAGRSSPLQDGGRGRELFREGQLSLSPTRHQGGNFVSGVGGVGRGGGGGGSGGEGSTGTGRVAGVAGGARRVNVSDHYGVAAEFMAKDPEADDDLSIGDMDAASGGGGSLLPNLTSRVSESVIGGNFPQGPLLARALTEIDRGIEAAAARREHHIYTAKALAALWVALLAGGALASSDGPMGYVARTSAAVLGGFLCAATSTLFLACWFSSKDEMQGLKEVFQTATNYERHLPMEEAFPDGGFDNSQFHTYMDQHFR